LPALFEGFGGCISEDFGCTTCESIFRKPDSNDGIVVPVVIGSKFPLKAGIKFWAAGGIKTRTGGLEDSGDN